MKFKFSYVLIGFAALGLGAMWVNVFSLFHHGPMAYIAGIPTSLAIVSILSKSANLLPRVQSKRARNAGWFFIGLVLVIEPIVLGMVNWWFMPVELQVSFISYVIAGGSALVVSLVLVLGALVDRSLVAVEKPVVQVAATGEKLKQNKKKVVRQPITDKQLNDFWLRNPNATNAEVAKHFGVTRQAIAKRRDNLYSVTGKDERE